MRPRSSAPALPVLLVLLALPCAAAPPQLKPPGIAAKESGRQVTRFQGEQAILYDFHWTLTTTQRDGRTIVHFQGHGDNDKQGKERIEWTESSEAELTATGLVPRSWQKDSSGAERESWRLDYDWIKGQARYTYANHLEDDRDETTIKLKPNSFAADAMNLQLRGFPFAKGQGHKLKGEFVMTDGSVMEGAVVHRGEGALNTPLGKLPVYKLELTIAGFTGLFAPAMYLYYSRTDPPIFLRFDGKDAGLLEGRTTNVLVEYEPRERLTPPAP